MSQRFLGSHEGQEVPQGLDYLSTREFLEVRQHLIYLVGLEDL